MLCHEALTAQTNSVRREALSRSQTGAEETPKSASASNPIYGLSMMCSDVRSSFQGLAAYVIVPCSPQFTLRTPSQASTDCYVTDTSLELHGERADASRNKEVRGTALRITTWNVENSSESSSNFQAKLAHLTNVLQQINPDVLAVQEVLTSTALDTLAAATGMTAVHGQRRATAFQRDDVATQLTRWSRIHNGVKELLDQVLASEGLMPLSNNTSPRIFPAVEILNSDAQGPGDRPRDDSVTPDHAPVTVTFPAV